MKLTTKLSICGSCIFLGGCVASYAFAYSPNRAIPRVSDWIMFGGCGVLLLAGTMAFVSGLRSRATRWSEYLTVGLGLSLGLFVWLSSGSLTGFNEPWDAPHFYYQLAMFFSGFVCGVLAPRCWFFSSVAVIFGQFLTRSSGYGLGYFPIGTVFLIIGGIPAVGGAVIGGGAVTGIRQLFGRSVRGGRTHPTEAAGTRQTPPPIPRTEDGPSGRN